MNFASFPQVPEVSCQPSSEPRSKRAETVGVLHVRDPSWHLSLLGKMKICLPAGYCGRTAVPRVRRWSQQEAPLWFRYEVRARICRSKLWVMVLGGAGVGLVYSCLFSYIAALGSHQEV